MTTRNNQVKLLLTDDELAFLDERCGSGSRAGYLRWLLRTSMPSPAPTYREALELLTVSARSGNIAAQVALARHLRDQSEAEDPIEDAIQKILDRD